MHPATDFAQKFSEVHPIPGIVSTITGLINDPESTMRQFEEVIQTDPVLVSRLISLVNSSYYGLNQKITSISRAVAFLGMKNLHNLVVTEAVKNIFSKPSQSSGFSKQDLWVHSSAVAICAKMVAERIFSIYGDDAFLCGILHDLGLLVEEHLHPEELSEICNSCQTISSMLELEQQTFATDHCEICHTITLDWQMPASIQNAILNHHQISDDIVPSSLIGIVQIAEYICDHLEYQEVKNVKIEISPCLSRHLEDNQDEYALLLEDLPDEIAKAQTIFQ